MSESAAEDTGAGAAGGAGEGAAAAAGAAGDGGGADQAQWRAALPEDLRDDPHLKNYTSLEDLAKGHINANMRISRSIQIPREDAAPEVRKEFLDKVMQVPGVTRIPDADASDEDKAAFWNSIGRPERSDGYDLKAPEFEGLEFEPGDTLKVWQDRFHAAGLNTAQAQALMNEYLADQAKVVGAAVEARAEGEKALRQEWGDQYAQRLQIAEAAVTQMMPEGFAELVQATGLHNHPVFIRGMEKIGRLGLEDEIIRDIVPQGQAFAGVEELRSEIADLRQSAPYTDARHPDHGRTVARVNAMYERIEAIRSTGKG